MPTSYMDDLARARHETATQVANVRTSCEASATHVRDSRAAITRSLMLLAKAPAA